MSAYGILKPYPRKEKCWNLRPQDVRIDVYQHVGTCLLAAEPDSSSVAGMTLAIDKIELMVDHGWRIWDGIRHVMLGCPPSQ